MPPFLFFTFSLARFPFFLFLIFAMSKKPTSSKIGNDSTSKKILKAIQANDGGYSLLSFVSDKMDIPVDRIDCDYSGRGMMSDYCTGFIVSDYGDASTLARQVRHLTGKAGNPIHASTDNMGMGFVIYCPSLGQND